MIDKKGVRDIQAGIYDYGSGGNQTVILRKAAVSDARFLYELRNEETVRQMSLSSDPFSFRNHREWLRKKLARGDSLMFIAEVDTIPIGQIRFEVSDDGEAKVSVSVCGEHRGKGYGSKIVKGASASFFGAFPKARIIHAFIKPANEPSLQVFAHSGYRRRGSAVVKGQSCVDMVLESQAV